jgi:hypothetical protein
MGTDEKNTLFHGTILKARSTLQSRDIKGMTVGFIMPPIFSLSPYLIWEDDVIDDQWRVRFNKNGGFERVGMVFPSWCDT